MGIFGEEWVRQRQKDTEIEKDEDTEGKTGRTEHQDK